MKKRWDDLPISPQESWLNVETSVSIGTKWHYPADDHGPMQELKPSIDSPALLEITSPAETRQRLNLNDYHC